MRYPIIYADPPWKYRDEANAGERGASHKYPTMEDADIIRMPVRQIAEKDAILFLWVTFPRLFISKSVMLSWGFEYKTCAFVWVKTYPGAQYKPFVGMGHYTRANVELCLIGTRGRPEVQSHSVRQLIEGVVEADVIKYPIGEHSEKPPVVRNRIVEMCGDIPRVELFARQSKLGFRALGNHIDGKDIFDALREEAEAKADVPIVTIGG